MLALTVAFWIMVFIFAMIGMLRGWAKEVVAMSAIILALFTINQFGSAFFTFLGWDNTFIPPPEIRRYEFYIMSGFLLLIAFFGFQGPALARTRVGDRLTRRDNLQDKLLGFLVGGTNGWLVVGSIWAFLEYKLAAASNWVRYPPEVPYPFDPTKISRPLPDMAPIIDNLPIPVLTQSPFILPLLLIVIFLFILIVLL